MKNFEIFIGGDYDREIYEIEEEDNGKFVQYVEYKFMRGLYLTKAGRRLWYRIYATEAGIEDWFAIALSMARKL